MKSSASFPRNKVLILFHLHLKGILLTKCHILLRKSGIKFGAWCNMLDAATGLHGCDQCDPPLPRCSISWYLLNLWHSSKLRCRVHPFILWNTICVFWKNEVCKFSAKENEQLVANGYSKIIQKYDQTMVVAFATPLHCVSFHWGCEMDVAMKVCCVDWYKGIPIGMGKASW